MVPSGRAHASRPSPENGRGAKLMQLASISEAPEDAGPPGKRTRGAQQRSCPAPLLPKPKGSVLNSTNASVHQNSGAASTLITRTLRPLPCPMCFLPMSHFAIAESRRP